MPPRYKGNRSTLLALTILLFETLHKYVQLLRYNESRDTTWLIFVLSHFNVDYDVEIWSPSFTRENSLLTM